MKKKQLLGSGCAAVLVLLLIGIWNLWFSSTRVAFVNYQVISLGQISKANDNSFIKIQKAADGGLPILTTSATNPANEIISLDSIQADTLRSYLENGGRRNYRSMLNYVRKHIDGKLISVDEPEAVTERSNDMIYHADPKKPDDEELGFNTIAGYNAGKRAVARGSSPYHNHWYDGRTGRPYPETGGDG